MYDHNSDKELNREFETIDHGNDSNNYNEEFIPRWKGQPIKKKKKNKPSSPIVKEVPLKATHNQENNEEDKDETMYIGYNKEEEEY